MDQVSPLPDDQIDLITERDEASADGLVVADDQVFSDRHILLLEVKRLREQMRTG